MILSVDTNVLVYILSGHQRYGKQSLDLISKLRSENTLVICDIVYAELSAFTCDKDKLAYFFLDVDIESRPMTEKSLFLAGEKWNNYNINRKIVCPSCNINIDIKCPQCKTKVLIKQHIIADFMIGAFSYVDCNGLISFDRGIYKTYFPELKMLFATTLRQKKK